MSNDQQQFPCEVCNQEVKSDENSIVCDICNQWFHQKCIQMSNSIFSSYIYDETLSWTCLNCGLADITINALNSPSLSDDEEDNSTHQQHVRSKSVGSLQVTVCNFQNIWNKRNELEDFMSSNKIDILIGSNTNLSLNFENSERLPLGFAAVRKDRPDGYGGVILIYKEVEVISHQQAEIFEDSNF